MEQDDDNEKLFLVSVNDLGTPGLWASVKDLLQSRSTLVNLTVHNKVGRAVTVERLMLQFVPTHDKRLQRLRPYTQSPVVWIRHPYAHVLLVATADVSEYRNVLKPALKRAIAELEHDWGGPPAPAPQPPPPSSMVALLGSGSSAVPPPVGVLAVEWVIVYVRPADLDVNDKAARKVYDKLKDDFSVRGRTRVIRIDTPKGYSAAALAAVGGGVASTGAWATPRGPAGPGGVVGPPFGMSLTTSVLGLEDLELCLRECVRSSFDSRQAAYMAEVQRLVNERRDPNWSFSSLYLVKDTLARLLEGFGLYLDAYKEYVELEAAYQETLDRQVAAPGALDRQVAAPGALGAGGGAGDGQDDQYGACGEGADLATLTSASWRATRLSTIKRSAVQEFRFRQYLFASQARLLLRLGRPVDVAERGLRFIAATAAELQQREGRPHGGVRPLLKEAWTFSACMAVITAVTACVYGRDTSSPGTYASGPLPTAGWETPGGAGPEPAGYDVSGAAPAPAGGGTRSGRAALAAFGSDPTSGLPRRRGNGEATDPGAAWPEDGGGEGGLGSEHRTPTPVGPQTSLTPGSFPGHVDWQLWAPFEAEVPPMDPAAVCGQAITPAALAVFRPADAEAALRQGTFQAFTLAMAHLYNMARSALLQLAIRAANMAGASLPPSPVPPTPPAPSPSAPSPPPAPAAFHTGVDGAAAASPREEDTAADAGGEAAADSDVAGASASASGAGWVSLLEAWRQGLLDLGPQYPCRGVVGMFVDQEEDRQFEVTPQQQATPLQLLRQAISGLTAGAAVGAGAVGPPVPQSPSGAPPGGPLTPRGDGSPLATSIHLTPPGPTQSETGYGYRGQKRPESLYSVSMNPGAGAGTAGAGTAGGGGGQASTAPAAGAGSVPAGPGDPWDGTTGRGAAGPGSTASLAAPGSRTQLSWAAEPEVLQGGEGVRGVGDGRASSRARHQHSSSADNASGSFFSKFDIFASKIPSPAPGSVASLPRHPGPRQGPAADDPLLPSQPPPPQQQQPQQPQQRSPLGTGDGEFGGGATGGPPPPPWPPSAFLPPVVSWLRDWRLRLAFSSPNHCADLALQLALAAATCYSRAGRQRSAAQLYGDAGAVLLARGQAEVVAELMDYVVALAQAEGWQTLLGRALPVLMAAQQAIGHVMLPYTCMRYLSLPSKACQADVRQRVLQHVLSSAGCSDGGGGAIVRPRRPPLPSAVLQLSTMQAMQAALLPGCTSKFYGTHSCSGTPALVPPARPAPLASATAAESTGSTGSNTYATSPSSGVTPEAASRQQPCREHAEGGHKDGGGGGSGGGRGGVSGTGSGTAQLLGVGDVCTLRLQLYSNLPAAVALTDLHLVLGTLQALQGGHPAGGGGGPDHHHHHSYGHQHHHQQHPQSQGQGHVAQPQVQPQAQPQQQPPLGGRPASYSHPQPPSLAQLQLQLQLQPQQQQQPAMGAHGKPAPSQSQVQAPQRNLSGGDLPPSSGTFATGGGPPGGSGAAAAAAAAPQQQQQQQVGWRPPAEPFGAAAQQYGSTAGQPPGGPMAGSPLVGEGWAAASQLLYQPQPQPLLQQQQQQQHLHHRTGSTPGLTTHPQAHMQQQQQQQLQQHPLQHRHHMSTPGIAPAGGSSTSQGPQTHPVAPGTSHLHPGGQPPPPPPPQQQPNSPSAATMAMAAAGSSNHGSGMLGAPQAGAAAAAAGTSRLAAAAGPRPTVAAGNTGGGGAGGLVGLGLERHMSSTSSSLSLGPMTGVAASYSTLSETSGLGRRAPSWPDTLSAAASFAQAPGPSFAGSSAAVRQTQGGIRMGAGGGGGLGQVGALDVPASGGGGGLLSPQGSTRGGNSGGGVGWAVGEDLACHSLVEVRHVAPPRLSHSTPGNAPDPEADGASGNGPSPATGAATPATPATATPTPATPTAYRGADPRVVILPPGLTHLTFRIAPTRPGLYFVRHLAASLGSYDLRIPVVSAQVLAADERALSGDWGPRSCGSGALAHALGGPGSLGAGVAAGGGVGGGSFMYGGLGGGAAGGTAAALARLGQVADGEVRSLDVALQVTPLVPRMMAAPVLVGGALTAGLPQWLGVAVAPLDTEWGPDVTGPGEGGGRGSRGGGGVGGSSGGGGGEGGGGALKAATEQHRGATSGGGGGGAGVCTTSVVGSPKGLQFARVLVQARAQSPLRVGEWPPPGAATPAVPLSGMASLASAGGAPAWMTPTAAAAASTSLYDIAAADAPGLMAMQPGGGAPAAAMSYSLGAGGGAFATATTAAAAAAAAFAHPPPAPAALLPSQTYRRVDAGGACRVAVIDLCRTARQEECGAGGKPPPPPSLTPCGNASTPAAAAEARGAQYGGGSGVCWTYGTRQGVDLSQALGGSLRSPVLLWLPVWVPPVVAAVGSDEKAALDVPPEVVRVQQTNGGVASGRFPSTAAAGGGGLLGRRSNPRTAAGALGNTAGGGPRDLAAAALPAAAAAAHGSRGPVARSLPSLELEVVVEGVAGGVWRSHATALTVPLQQPFRVRTSAHQLPSGHVLVSCSLTCCLVLPVLVTDVAIEPQYGLALGGQGQAQGAGQSEPPASLLAVAGVLPLQLAPGETASWAFMLSRAADALPALPGLHSHPQPDDCCLLHMAYSVAPPPGAGPSWPAAIAEEVLGPGLQPVCGYSYPLPPLAAQGDTAEAVAAFFTPSGVTGAAGTAHQLLSYSLPSPRGAPLPPPPADPAAAAAAAGPMSATAAAAATAVSCPNIYSHTGTYGNAAPFGPRGVTDGVSGVTSGGGGGGAASLAFSHGFILEFPATNALTHNLVSVRLLGPHAAVQGQPLSLTWLVTRLSAPPPLAAAGSAAADDTSYDVAVYEIVDAADGPEGASPGQVAGITGLGMGVAACAGTNAAGVGGSGGGGSWQWRQSVGCRGSIRLGRARGSVALVEAVLLPVAVGVLRAPVLRLRGLREVRDEEAAAAEYVVVVSNG